MPYFSYKNCNFYYQRDGEGAPVVFVHGGFASLSKKITDLKPGGWGWEQEFSKEFSLIIYDRRGCYRSSCPQSGYDLHSQVRDLEALLDHLNLESAHIIGSSAGGPIALMFAAIKPERTRSLVCVGTGLQLFPEDDPCTGIVKDCIAVLDREGVDAAFDKRPSDVEVTLGELWNHREAIAFNRLDQYRRCQQHWRKAAESFSREQRINYYAAELRSMQAYLTTNVEAYTQYVRAPTYILHGAKDRIIPSREAKKLANALPSSQFKEIIGAGHGLFLENNNSRQLVKSFIKG